MAILSHKIKSPVLLPAGTEFSEFSTEDTFSGNSDITVKSEKAIRSFVNSKSVVGEVILWFTDSPPTGFLECDGASIDTTVYADLFAVIGYSFGGSGSSFALPDTRGEFLRAWDHGAGKDPDSTTRTDRGDGTTGDFVGTKQVAAVEEFYGAYYDARVGGSKIYDLLTADDLSTGSTSIPKLGTGTGLATIRPTKLDGSAQISQALETRGRNIYTMYCIRYE